MPLNIDLVIFDCDGVLVDSEVIAQRDVERWQLLDRIRQHRRCAPSRRRVRGWRRVCGLCQSLGSSESRQRCLDGYNTALIGLSKKR
jgi:beta-phosphoglucomutase-like phosphatase (HAD superfamily)